jgi:amino acid adenylation domain-containing protein
MTELSDDIRARLRRRTPARTIERRPEGEAPPLSYAQERLWFMDQYAPGTTAYTIPLARRIRTAIDPDDLTSRLAAIVARHEPLRMRFTPEVVLYDAVIPLTMRTADSETQARTLISEFLSKPFDLSAGPVCRAMLVQLAPDDHVLAFALHHIAGDGWSAEILLRELLDGAAPELPVRYGDYARWQRTRDDAADLTYWRTQLDGVQPVDLPTDRPRPPELTYQGAPYGFQLGHDLTDRITRLARDHGATPYMVMLAAFVITLGRHAGQDDMTIGSPAAGRSRPEFENLIGCFVNTLALRVRIDQQLSFADMLASVRDTTLDAFSHQDLPFERLVAELDIERDVARSPVFQVLFAFQNYAATAAEGFSLDEWATRFDLELYANEDKDGLTGLFIYNTALFDAARIERLSGHLLAVLDKATAEPHIKLAELDLLTPAERAERLLWNDTAVDFGPPECLSRPTALIHPGGALSSDTLERRARHLAAKLDGVQPNELVAVVMERGWEQVVAVRAITMAGGAYLPIDADLPEERRRHLIERGECRYVITQARFAEPGWLVVTEDEAEIIPGNPATPADLAYVIFTSGSTGEPKGVMIEHRMAWNTIRDINQRFGVGPDDKILQLSALSFDLSVYDIFNGLATLVMPDPSADKDPAAWARLVAEQRITVWNTVPALMELLVDHAEHEGTDISSLRLVMMSGDWIPLSLPGRIRALAPDAQIISLGGATEGSIWSIHHPIGDVDPSWTSIPYGRPLANQSFRILDAHMRDVPVGVTGDLYIGGVGVARGYWRDPERTQAAFVDGMYRTGDLGRYGPDGTIEFLGRADTQVKIRGYRVELGEIEAQLSRHPDVADCVVATRGERTNRQLVAYIVLRNEVDLRAHLAGILPAYMVPTWFVTLDRLPLTANGKVDRARLPAPEAPTRPSATVETDTERAIAAIWAELLELPVGADDNFFSLGGHSLLAIKAVAQIRRSLGQPVAVMDLFKYQTVRELAAQIGTAEDRGLLYELTPTRQTTVSYVCVPYGGGSAAVYQPLADALPDNCALWSVAIPGHDVGLDEESLPFHELAARCASEIQAKVRGPIVLYGHCGVGSALTVAIATRLEAAGRPADSVYIGAIFPFARPGSRRMGRVARLEFLRGDRTYANWLTSMGVDMSDLEPGQAKRIIRNMRRDTDAAEEYFTGLFQSSTRLKAPIIAVVGDQDPATEFHQERFREWHFLTDTAKLVVLDEAGHFFLKYRAAELADIITGGTSGAHWRQDSTSLSTAAPVGPQPSMRRFLGVAAGQLVSLLGSALTQFAIPLWIYLTTGSLAQFALFAVIGLVPGMLVAPLAGAIVDRGSRRTVMLAGDVASGVIQLALGVLLWTGNLAIWHIYPLLGLLSVATTFQRLAYTSAVPQLVPKRYLGHANGIVQLAGGTSQLLVPIAAVGLMAGIGLEGILIIDVLSYVIAIGVTVAVRFPGTMAWRRKEPLLAETLAGLRYSWGNAGFRRMLVFFAVLNVFLSPLFLMISPLVLSFTTLADVGLVSFMAGLGVFLGGLGMTAWGGPKHGRMRGVLLSTLVLSAFCLITSLRPDLVLISIGAFGMSLWLTLLNGIYTTIVQVKVPQRLHGRVFALNTLVAWSTLPIGFGLVAPYASTLLEPVAPSFSTLIGTGPGRGIALMYLLFALAIAVIAVVALRSKLARFDDEVPDAVPDDLLGVKALADPAVPAGKVPRPGR